ncbi:hypothetical protein AB0I28_20435 [Phytomonospora sp. NPDC050363]|uniref:hypothetical protein n=1 Tax=Phytomonospora sp. NPDC050363 TaxID=3155642 RepID=UPI0033C4E880
MATVTHTPTTVRIAFGPFERLFTGRATHTIPVEAIREASAIPDAVGHLRGARRGLEVTGLVKVGVWGVFGRRRTLAAAYRGVPGLRLVLDGDEFAEVVVSHAGAGELAAALGRVAS